MFVRTPQALVALLALAVCAIALPDDSSGLLLLTPALALILPLLFSFYPGEESVTRLAAWFSRLQLPEASGPDALPLFSGSLLSFATGFTGSNASRGPPSFPLH